MDFPVYSGFPPFVERSVRETLPRGRHFQVFLDYRFKVLHIGSRAYAHGGFAPRATFPGFSGFPPFVELASCIRDHQAHDGIVIACHRHHVEKDSFIDTNAASSHGKKIKKADRHEPRKNQ